MSQNFHNLTSYLKFSWNIKTVGCFYKRTLTVKEKQAKKPNERKNTENMVKSIKKLAKYLQNHHLLRNPVICKFMTSFFLTEQWIKTRSSLTYDVSKCFEQSGNANFPLHQNLTEIVKFNPLTHFLEAKMDLPDRASRGGGALWGLYRYVTRTNVPFFRSLIPVLISWSD